MENSWAVFDSIIISLIAQAWALIFYRTESNLSKFVWLSVRIKRKRFVFNHMRLFYFKGKPTTPLRHLVKNMKKTHVPVKNLFVRRFLKHLWKQKKKEETYTKIMNAWLRYPHHHEKGNKGYKEKTGRKMLGNQLSSF